MRHIIPFLIISVALAVNGNEEDTVIILNCFREIGIDAETYQAAMQKNDTKEVDEKIKCMNACMFKSHKIMREDGSMDLEMFINHLPASLGDEREIYKRFIEKCSKEKVDNDCETAHNIMMCMQSEAKKLSN